MRAKANPSKMALISCVVLLDHSDQKKRRLAVNPLNFYTLDNNIIQKLREFYWRVYMTGIIYPNLVMKYSFYRNHTKSNSINRWSIECKNTLCVRYRENFAVDDEKAQETGDYFVLEILEVKLPLIPDHLLMHFNPFIIYLFEDGSQDVIRLTSFNRRVNQSDNHRPFVQEIFVKSKPCGGDMYLVVKGIAGNSEKILYVNGLRKLAHLKRTDDGVALKLISSPRSLVISREEFLGRLSGSDLKLTESAETDNIGEISPMEIAECEKKWTMRQRKGEALNYLVMELSNEDAIGLMPRKTERPIRHINGMNKTGVSRYCLISGQKDVSPSSSSASSGYSSLSESSSSIERPPLVVECDVKNSCVICGATFKSAIHLLFHLEFRYPQLSVGYDESNPSEITIKLNPSRFSSSCSGKAINFSKKSAVAERCKFLEKVGSTVKSAKKRKNFNLITDSDLPFNMPAYDVLSGGLYGVETPRNYLNTLNARRITEFGDVGADEKVMMLMWNEFVNRRENRVVSENTGSRLLRKFTKEYSSEILSGRGILQFLSHCSIKYMHHEVNNDAIRDSLLHLVEEFEASKNNTSAIARPFNSSRSRKRKSTNKL